MAYVSHKQDRKRDKAFRMDAPYRYERIPLFMMCWEFPGTGAEYPIQPGSDKR